MQHFTAPHSGARPSAINQTRQPSLTLDGVRRAATLCPCLLEAAAGYAARFYPKAGSLIRGVWE